MGKNKTPCALPQAVVELINRMTPQEKQELSRLLNWKELEQLKEAKASPNGRRHGDPKFYLGTTPKGLNLEIPTAKVNDVLLLLLKELSPTNIEISLINTGEFRELELSPEAFTKLINTDPEYFSKRHALIEMDDNEIVSAGEGCICIVLSPAIMPKRSRISTKILSTCGYPYQIRSTQFYAIVWEKDLEVEEK